MLVVLKGCQCGDELRTIHSLKHAPVGCDGRIYPRSIVSYGNVRPEASYESLAGELGINTDLQTLDAFCILAYVEPALISAYYAH